MRELIEEIKKKINRCNYPSLSSRSAELAFFILLSIFPTILFFISAVAFLPEFHLEKCIGMFYDFLPSSIFSITSTIVMSAVDNKSEYFIFVSLFLMLWSVSRAVKALIKGMNSAYRVCESRSFIKIMYISVLFTLALIALLFISIILLIYGEKIGYVIFSFIRLDYIFIPVWNVTRYSIGLLTTIFIFVLMYKYTPNKKVKIKEVIIGSVFSTFAWFFVSYFYSYYTNNLANYEAIYGSIAEIIVLITWIYFSSWVIVIGYEINARIFIKKESLESIEKIIKKK